MAAPMILAFNMPPEKLGRLRLLAARIKARLRVVGPGEYQCKLVDIVASPALASQISTPLVESEFDDEMLVMVNLTGAQMNLFLGDFKRFGIPPVPLKAVLTAINCEWTPVVLHKELCAEREAFAQGFSAHEQR